MRRGLISVAVFVAFVAIYTLSRHVTGPSTSTTSTTVTPTTTTTTTLASTACQSGDFSGVFVEGQGAAGTIQASIKITKTTAGSCTLKGWPLLTLQDRLGAVLPARIIDVPSTGNAFQFDTAQANKAPATLTLAQNATANFALGYSDVQTGATACASAVTLSVQFVPSGAAINITPQYAVTPCNGGQMWVSPFY